MGDWDDTDFLFSGAEAVRARPAAVLSPRCGECGFKDNCQSPKMPPDGRGEKRILVVGEAPGKDEDAQGKPWVGRAGGYLAERARDAGISLRRDCKLTNAMICRPPGNDPAKTVRGNAVDHCRPNLLKLVAEFDPVVVVLLGVHAVRSLVGHMWKSEVKGVGRWTGWAIPGRKPNAWVCPSYHPAFLLRAEDRAADADFTNHLRAARELADRGTRPWPDGPPDHAAQIDVVADPAAAAARLRRYTGGTIAFDYETTTLRSNGPDAEIVCASVCWEGVETIAFPWHGDAVRAMKTLLANPDVAKMGWNAKFETLWTKTKLGIDVAGWAWCGMLAAHALDPRGGISGLKFQAFARTGEPDYAAHVEPYLDSREKGGHAPNRVRELALPTLMKYCGMDSLLEYKVGRVQQHEMGVAGPPDPRDGYPAR